MSSNEHGEVGHVVLDGIQTMQTADTTHVSLMAAIAQHDVLELDCTRVQEADVSFIQLILAARASARRAGRAIRLSQPAAASLRGALERGGFLDGPDSPDRNFWLGSANT